MPQSLVQVLVEERLGGQRHAHVLPDVPHSHGHDVSRMGLPHYDCSRGLVLPHEQLVHGHAGGVVASSYVGVFRPAVEELAVGDYLHLLAHGVPGCVRIPCFYELEPPGAGHEHDDPPVVQLLPLVDPELADGLVEPRGLEHVLADDVVHGGDAPSGGDEAAVLADPHGPDGERLLDLGYQGAVVVRRDDSVDGFHVGVVEALLQVPLEPAVALPHALHPCGRAEGLDLVVQHQPSLGLLSELRLQVHGLLRQRQLLHVIDDPSGLGEVGGVYPVLPADQPEPEIHDLLDALAHPHLGAVHDRGVAVFRRQQRAYVHLGVPVAADEDRRGRGSSEVLHVDERPGPLLGVELHHQGAAVLAAEPVSSFAYDAEPVLDDAAAVPDVVEGRCWQGHVASQG